jgi:hypothetical protein
VSIQQFRQFSKAQDGLVKVAKGSDVSAGDEHFTPKWLFDALGVVFDLDVSAPLDLQTHVPSRNKYTVVDDGLIQPWFGNVWCNPPYSQPTPWVEKFIYHRCGIALLPMTRGKWWFKLWNEADAIMPVAHNLKFELPDGKTKPITFNPVLFAFGASNVEALHKSELFKVR